MHGSPPWFAPSTFIQPCRVRKHSITDHSETSRPRCFKKPVTCLRLLSTSSSILHLRTTHANVSSVISVGRVTSMYLRNACSWLSLPSITRISNNSRPFSTYRLPPFTPSPEPSTKNILFLNRRAKPSVANKLWSLLPYHTEFPMKRCSKSTFLTVGIWPFIMYSDFTNARSSFVSRTFLAYCAARFQTSRTNAGIEPFWKIFTNLNAKLADKLLLILAKQLGPFHEL